MADLTRLAQTLMHVQNIYWIVVEDSSKQSRLVSEYLNQTGIAHSYFTSAKRWEVKIKGSDVRCKYEGLQWVREHATSGVVYFADDDNSYDIRIFEEMRWTRKLSMWPVGCLFGNVESPVVRNGKVIQWQHPGPRMFKVDFAGFAVSVSYLQKYPKIFMCNTRGCKENSFLLSLGLKLDDIEPKAKNCTQILVWHVKTKSHPLTNQTTVPQQFSDTNLPLLYKRFETA